MFQDLAAAPWALFVIFGAIILGGVLAYGSYMTSKRTQREKELTEAGTRAEYAREDAQKHPNFPD